MSSIPAIPIRRSQRISNDLTPSKITSSLNQLTPGRTTARRNLQQRLQSQLQPEISRRNEEREREREREQERNGNYLLNDRANMAPHHLPMRRVSTTLHNPLPSDISISDLLEETPSRFFAPSTSINGSNVASNTNTNINNHNINNNGRRRSNFQDNNDHQEMSIPVTPTIKSNRGRSKSSVGPNSEKKRGRIAFSNHDSNLANSLDSSKSIFSFFSFLKGENQNQNQTEIPSENSKKSKNFISLIFGFLWKSMEIFFKITFIILTPLAKILFSSGKGFGKLMFYATPKSKKLRTNIIARWKLIVILLFSLFLAYFIFQFRRRGSDLAIITSLRNQILDLDRKMKESQLNVDQYIKSLNNDLMIKIDQRNQDYETVLNKLKIDQNREIDNLSRHQNSFSTSLNSIDQKIKKYGFQSDHITQVINEIMEKLMEIDKRKKEITPPPSSLNQQSNDSYEKEKKINYDRIKGELLKEINSSYLDKDEILELLHNFKSTIISNSHSSSSLNAIESLSPSSVSSQSISVSLSMINYANIALGARIISRLTSKTFEDDVGSSFPFLKKLGLGKGGNYLARLFTLDGLNSYGPMVTLNGRLDLGNCWPFKGNQGQIAIQLRDPILLTHFSIGHSREGPNQFSAPNDVELYALLPSSSPIQSKSENEREEKKKHDNEHVKEGIKEKLVFLSKKIYDIQSPLEIQTFETIKPIKSDKFILKINNNHGHGNYTCIYRIGLHSQI